MVLGWVPQKYSKLERIWCHKRCSEQHSIYVISTQFSINLGWLRIKFKNTPCEGWFDIVELSIFLINILGIRIRQKVWFITTYKNEYFVIFPELFVHEKGCLVSTLIFLPLPSPSPSVFASSIIQFSQYPISRYWKSLQHFFFGLFTKLLHAVTPNYNNGHVFSKDPQIVPKQPSLEFWARFFESNNGLDRENTWF